MLSLQPSFPVSPAFGADIQWGMPPVLQVSFVVLVLLAAAILFAVIALPRVGPAEKLGLQSATGPRPGHPRPRAVQSIARSKKREDHRRDGRRQDGAKKVARA